jgi:hypothetical protein
MSDRTLSTPTPDDNGVALSSFARKGDGTS